MVRLNIEMARAACSLGTLRLRRNRRSRVIYLMLDSLLCFSPMRSVGLVLCGTCLVLTCVPSCCTLMRLVRGILCWGQWTGLTILTNVLRRVGDFVIGCVCRSVRVL